MRQYKNSAEIVAFSGGKDSTAMALRLEEIEPNPYRRFLYTATGDELPPMNRHLELMIEKLHSHRVWILNGITLGELIDEQKCIPNYRMRFCTRILKIEPCIEYLRQFKNPILCVGLRADEPLRQGLYDEYVINRFPLREWRWGLKEVQDYLKEKNVIIPDRTDCAMCYYQRLIDWWRLWKYYPSRFLKAEMLEMQTGHTFRAESKDKHPTSLYDLRKAFENGWIPKYRKNINTDSRGGCRVCSM